jgi:para-aminobenzoate synthetase/4-amino-4-deoxychorismate lyase
VLNRSGSTKIAWEPAEDPNPLRVGLATEPVNSDDVFLYHKTTQRAVYEQALGARPDCGDVLLWNERGELTESTRANIVVELDGRRFTPPIRCGLLGGVFRAHLIERNELVERVIRKDELLHATGLWLINSVRKWMDVAEILDHAEESPCVTP